MKKEKKYNKDFCLICNKYINPIIIEKNLIFNDNDIKIEYLGKEAICPHCNENIYDDDVVKYNQKEIKKAYIEKYEIITNDEIKEIIERYNIGKRPLSLLLGFGEITITRYLDGYVPTCENSRILKVIYNSPSDYYSILLMNKNKISEVAFKKSLSTTQKLLDVQTSDDLIFEVSKYIINKIDVTNMALQKLLYYVQMFYMAFNNTHVFNSKCNAWDYGPVFGSVYYKYKSFGKSIIEDEKTNINFDSTLKETIDHVLKYFGCYSGWMLKNFTHIEEPWLEAYNSDNKVIEKTTIKEYGDKIVKELNINSITEINKYSEALYKKIQNM